MEGRRRSKVTKVRYVPHQDWKRGGMNVLRGSQYLGHSETDMGAEVVGTLCATSFPRCPNPQKYGKEFNSVQSNSLRNKYSIAACRLYIRRGAIVGRYSSKGQQGREFERTRTTTTRSIKGSACS